MALHVDPRYVGNVCVLECRGQIVIGQDVKKLEAALQLAGHEFNRIVLAAGKVERMDSTAIGLIVRSADSFRKRGGDLRIADPPEFLGHLLITTRLNGWLKVYPTEDEAILSFLRQPFADKTPEQPGRRVLVIDRSPEVGAFIRAVLMQHGYQVKTASLVSDARMVLMFQQVDYIVFGPATPDNAVQDGSAALRSLAPKAVPLSLNAEFATCDACNAAEVLLGLFRNAGQPA